MIYLDSMTFPNAEKEFDFFLAQKLNCYNTWYPFQVLSARHLERLDFEPVTILYGGNGTGKSTVLHVIAEKLGLIRESAFNRSSFFGDYLELCEASVRGVIPPESRIITSDDVFDYMLDIRSLNDGVDRRREETLAEYLDIKYTPFRMESLDDYEKLKKKNRTHSRTQSRYVREAVPKNVREYSNGENAFRYFTEKIGENGLYLLDEPENSLSPARQQELVRFLEDSARYFGCQFIISTHSPFVLAMSIAKIYDLDEDPVNVKRWTELESVRAYYEFFRSHDGEFL